MGGLKSYSVSSRLHICGGAIRLFAMSATEYSRYVPWIHRVCSVCTTEDSQHPTCVTMVRRMHVEPAVCTLGFRAGGSPRFNPRI